MVIRTNTQRIGTEVVDMVTRNLFGETTRNMRNMNAAGTMRTTTRPMVRKGPQIKIRTLTMKDATAGASEVCCRHRLVQRINQRNDMNLTRTGARLLLQSAVLAVLMTGTALAFTGEKLL